ncbi:DEAD/DEAH box helicase family protein, partial [Clostridium butyricum]
MNKNIKFVIENLPYQNKAVESVINLFDGVVREFQGIYGGNNRAVKFYEKEPGINKDIVSPTRLRENLKKVQLENNLFLSDYSIEGNNFSVEMETGTGKTYVYLKTILELNQQYGINKFIIIVPSVAIRTGVQKSIEMFSDEFKRDYNGIEINKYSFVYDSNKLKEISTKLVETRDLSICIMNNQLFNKDNNKIRKEDEYGQILWEDIKKIRPVLIIDEPQKIEGVGKKQSESMKKLLELNPLFILRYSATHRKLYNQVYKLDSYDAFKNDLVKKIEVKTINSIIPKDIPYIKYINFTNDLKAKIEIFTQGQGGRIKFNTFSVRGGASLYDLSGGLKQYSNMRIAEDPHKLKPLKISTPESTIELVIGESNIKHTDNNIIRIQIELTIRTHLDKQFEILDKGQNIKVLSLFFIDEVSKVRDESSKDGRGEYLKIFDELYSTIIKEEKYKNKFEEYKEFFTEYNNTLNVREGYFAIDKKNKVVDIEDWDSSKEDVKLKSKSQEDVDRGIQLILNKKEELISFKEPLAFIFSHSALREGWDNPNVFNICTLKQGASDIAKKQEIGRGLRLPVDITGRRCKRGDINHLTVIANDNYEHFAEMLQKDYNENMNFNKDEITPDLIIRTFKAAGIPNEKISAELVNILKTELLSKKIINNKNILTKECKKINEITFNNSDLKEHEELIKKKLIEFMIDRGSKRVPVINGDNDQLPPNRPQSYVTEEIFQKIIEKLCINLKKRT